MWHTSLSYRKSVILSRMGIAEDSIIVVRGLDGEVRAFFNVCRNRGSQICQEKSGNTRRFVCPYHAWGCDLDGQLVSARHMPSDLQYADYGMHCCQIEVLEGLIFISLASKSSAEVFADKG